MKTNSAWDTHTRITDLFLGLTREHHSKGILDPDLQIGLGVLFYTNSDYDHAKDCFATALGARPKVRPVLFSLRFYGFDSRTGLSPLEQARFFAIKR
jgi:hypothetical protein